MRQRFLCLVFVLAAAAAGCSRADEPAAAAPTTAPGTSAPAGERKYLLERIDDAAVVQLYADQFAALPLKEKTLAYHLAQAALAGRDIFYDQKHRNALEMRGVLEAILMHSNGIEMQTLSEIERYTKLFWVNNGPYNNLTARKFVLKITPQALATAAQIAEKSGATFPTQSGESVEALLKRLEPMFFDPNADPIVTNKNPGPGKDILTASANNLYSGVSMADLKGFSEKNGLNSRLVKTNGSVVEEESADAANAFTSATRRSVEPANGLPPNGPCGPDVANNTTCNASDAPRQLSQAREPRLGGGSVVVIPAAQSTASQARC